ncbi:hypothetical protein CKO25_02925 [Thiocapsa imhoffii]|uniref:Uncharacterized protein n=1 Tax=Thiocapsa imhoffii TaxID=382777 RepID=A0A9X0WG98_9GAMM|nr:hypothetical protein [Thiocapsa imhoffii]MBK1643627.1 hypothetical protein [Thiocapsa imhoffii]
MIEIRLGTEGDRGQILERMEEVYGVAPARRAERLWDWQWHQDPRLERPGYRGVVAVWRGHLIGNLATIPAGLFVDGAPCQAWWFVDVLVHWGLTRQALREHKRTAQPVMDSDQVPNLSRGIAAALFDHPAAGPIQLGKHVADPMARIGERVGFAPVAQSGGFHRRITLRHPIARVLGTQLGDLTGALIEQAMGPWPRPELPVEPHLGDFDARFDQLWQRVVQRYPAICQRDARLLNWRYRDHPDGGHHVLTVSDGQTLRGYCVVRAFDQGRRRRGKILDLLTAPEDQRARASLFAAALHELRRERVERAEIFVSDAALTSLVGALGFTPKLSKSGRPGPILARHLPAVAEPLYVTQGDGDGG